MKKQILILTVLFVSTSVYSQEIEKMKIYYDWGKTKLKEVYYVIVDTPTKHGAYSSWYEDGDQHETATFKNGKLTGVYKLYDQYGNLEDEINYAEGKRHGICTEYDYYDNYTRREYPVVTKQLWENGKHIEDEKYFKDKLIEKAWYKDDGKSIYKMEQVFKSGYSGVYESFGWAKEYYPTGELYTEYECCEFKSTSDKIEPWGIFRVFYKSGNLKLYKIFDKYHKQYIHEEFEDMETDNSEILLRKRHSLLFVSENDLFDYLLVEENAPSNVSIPSTIEDFSIEEKVFFNVMRDAPDYIFERLINKFSNSAWSDRERIVAIINMAK